MKKSFMANMARLSICSYFFPWKELAWACPATPAVNQVDLFEIGIVKIYCGELHDQIK